MRIDPLPFLPFERLRRSVQPRLSLFSERGREWLRAVDPKTRRRNRRYLRQRPPASPVPPEHLLVQVAGSADIEWFVEGGRRAFDSIADALSRHDRKVDELERVLDFGCGCGRVARYWLQSTPAELHGVDYNRRLVSWCQQHLPAGRFSVSQLSPPLAYPAESFDFIFALSVFTHLPAALQHAWIDEFSRILRPDGLLLITTHGEHYHAQLSAAEQVAFDRGDLVVRHAVVAGTNRCTTFHPPEYIRTMLPRGLMLIDYLPEAALGNPHQDIVLLGKRH